MVESISKYRHPIFLFIIVICSGAALTKNNPVGRVFSSAQRPKSIFRKYVFPYEMEIYIGDEIVSPSNN